MEQSPLTDLFEAFRAVFGSGPTFNSMLVHEVMGLRSTEHFERVDSHWTSDGVLVKYRCNLDGREYHVKVTAKP